MLHDWAQSVERRAKVSIASDDDVIAALRAAAARFGGKQPTTPEALRDAIWEGAGAALRITYEHGVATLQAYDGSATSMLDRLRPTTAAQRRYVHMRASSAPVSLERMTPRSASPYTGESPCSTQLMPTLADAALDADRHYSGRTPRASLARSNHLGQRMKASLHAPNKHKQHLPNVPHHQNSKQEAAC